MLLAAITVPNGNCSNGDARLIPPIDNSFLSTREGRLELCINEAWGSVCDSAFDNNDASVACGQLTGLDREGITPLIL